MDAKVKQDQAPKGVCVPHGPADDEVASGEDSSVGGQAHSKTKWIRSHDAVSDQGCEITWEGECNLARF